MRIEKTTANAASSYEPGNNLIPSIARKKVGFLLSKLAPGWSHSRIDNLLLIPESSRATVRVPRKIEQSVLDTKHGKICMYRIGTGPAVVFVHGLGGRASQFFAIMQGLARIGFTAVAFDHLGHGQSEIKRSDLQQFIATTNEVLSHTAKQTKEGLYSVAAHSTGCIAVANARPALLKHVRLFLVSPVFNFRLFFLKRLVKLNLHPNLLKQYTSRFARLYEREYCKLELRRTLARYGDVTVIAHDESDKTSPVADSINFCRRYPLTRLRLTRGFGHSRILDSESIWQELKSHLDYDDTTINFTETLMTEYP